MTSILDLPDELLFKVVDGLEPADINVLFLIPELRFRLKQAICLFTDHSRRHHRNITTVYLLDGSMHVDVEKILRSVHCCIIEIHNWTTEFRGVMNDVCCTIPHHLVFYPDRLISSTLRIRPSTFPITHRTLSLTCNMEDVYDDMATLSPEIYRFPLASKVNWTHCSFPSDTGQKFQLPNLKSAHIHGSALEDFFRSTDISTLSNLKVLEASSRETVVDWRDIHVTTLSEIRLCMEKLVSLSDCTFPSLVFLDVTATNLSSISQLFLPKVQTMKLTSANPLHINDVEAPSLLQLHISVESLSLCERFRAPSLSKVILFLNGITADRHGVFEIQRGDCDMDTSGKHPIDLSFLENVEDFHFLDTNNMLINTKNVNVPPMVKMTDLRLYYPLHVGNWSYCQSRELRRLILQFLVIYRTDSTLESLLKHHPKLSQLQVSQVSSVSDSTVFIEINDIHVRELKSLKLPRTGPNLAISIDNTHFDNLEVLEIWQPTVPSDSTTLSSILNFTAPKLKCLSIRGFKGIHLDITKFPMLKALTITGCLRYITFGEKHDSLQRLCLSQNKNLLPVFPTVLKNVTDFYAYDTPFESLRNIQVPSCM